MKLLFCVVSNKDAANLLEKLLEKDYRATKLSSTGGFLKEGNTTLLMGIEDEQVEEAVEIIKMVCSSRKQVVTTISPFPVPPESMITYPVEITIGGATIFILNIEKHIRV